MANFRVEYDNDTGPNDEGFFEYWSVTNDELSFRVDSSQQDADWLAGVLNAQAPPAAAVPEGYALVPVTDLESLAFTDFGRAFWTDGAEAAALRIRSMLAAAEREGK